jgi:hypothetical protein
MLEDGTVCSQLTGVWGPVLARGQFCRCRGRARAGNARAGIAVTGRRVQLAGSLRNGRRWADLGTRRDGAAAGRFPPVTTLPHAVDVRRRAGWLPEDQDDLESWLAGHRERAEARGGQVVLHPVLTEFQELIDTDPVVRMHINQMIAQVPGTKP